MMINLQIRITYQVRLHGLIFKLKGSYEKKIKAFTKNILEIIFKYLGYEVSLKKIRTKELLHDGKLNLNIAAGNYIIPGFKSLDLFTPHYYKSREEFFKLELNMT